MHLRRRRPPQPREGAALPNGSRPFGGREENAERRRAALRRLLKQTGLTPARLARIAGYYQPNHFYNFLKGRAGMLSLEAIERIMIALPEVSFEQLVGWQLPAAYHQPRPDDPASGGPGAGPTKRPVRIALAADQPSEAD